MDEELKNILLDFLSKELKLPKNSTVVIISVAVLSLIFKFIQDWLKEGFPKIPSIFLKKKTFESIEDIDKLKFGDDKGKENYKNSLIFSKITGRKYPAPIEIVNWIFNCFDPKSAICIYIKAPAFITLEKTQLGRTELRKSSKIKLSRYFMIVQLICSLLLLGTCLCEFSLIVRSYSVLNEPNGAMLFSLSIIFFAIFTILGFIWFDYCLKELDFLNYVDFFYKAYDSWKDDNGNDDKPREN